MSDDARPTQRGHLTLVHASETEEELEHLLAIDEVSEAHEGSADEDVADGLELDDRQSLEIRQIFGTTLPQYLLPVEEMVEQLLGGDGAPDTLPALLGTLESLAAAAARMGFDEVHERLQRLGQLAGEIELAATVQAQQTCRQAIGEALDELKSLAAAMGGNVAEVEAGESLFKALGRRDADGASILDRLSAEGVQQPILQRLSAAGVVTVEQLRGADTAEVAAVSGLDRAVVERLRAHLDRLPAAQPAGALRRTESRVPPEQVAAEAGACLGAGEPQGALRGGAPGDSCGVSELETAPDDIRAEVRRLALSVRHQRQALRAAEERCTELRRDEQRTRALLGDRLRALAEARLELEELTRRGDALQATLTETEERLRGLRTERLSLSRQDIRVGRELDVLVRSVGGLLRLFAQGRPAGKGERPTGPLGDQSE